METKHLFPTPLWIEDNCGLDLNRITRWVDIVWEEDTIGRAASNDGGWQSQDFVPPYICDDHALTELYNKIIATAYNCADDFGFRHYTLEVSNLWMNVNTKGHFNHLHNHTGSILSGVYYAKVPTCCSGDIKFLKPFYESSLKESWGCADNFDNWENPANENEHYHTPKENQMVIFPSWLAHSVDKSSSQDDRISLSFNIHVFSNIYRDNEVYPSKQSRKSNVPLSLV